MFRLLSLLVLLTACATTQKGGGYKYIYQAQGEYTQVELKEMAPKIVTTYQREPQKGTFKDLFSKKQPGIKRVGIIVFESMIQNSLTGLATHDRVYLSDQGKQLLTEKLLSVWEEGMKIVDPELDYVPTAKAKKTKHFKEHGTDVTNYVLARREGLAPDDVFFLDTGKKISMIVTHNPRNMRDVSLLLVPASDLMAGPKWSEHAKQYANDVAKELDLDAVIVVKSTISWTAEHMDKNSGAFTPEETTIRIKTTSIVPLSRYNQRLKNINIQDGPNHNLSFRTYEGELNIPVNLQVSKENESFDTAMSEVIGPAMKAYKDLAIMTMIQMTQDFRETR